MHAKNDPIIQKMIIDATSDETDFYIKLELKDIETIINAEGLTSTLFNVSRGENASDDSLKPIIKNYKDCENISAMLLCFTIHKTFPVMVIYEATKELYKVFTGEEDILFSILIDNDLEPDEIYVNTIVKHSKVKVVW